MQFTERERAILAVLQGNLPDTLMPFADIARQCGVKESEVLDLINRLKTSGAIRRFGASLRHNKAGWKYNVMAGWAATEEEAEKYAPVAVQNPNISHVYFRPSPAPDWPYTLYTMIHGRSEEECNNVINDLLSSWPLRQYAVLRTLRELKKISPTYF